MRFLRFLATMMLALLGCAGETPEQGVPSGTDGSTGGIDAAGEGGSVDATGAGGLGGGGGLGAFADGGPGGAGGALGTGAGRDDADAFGGLSDVSPDGPAPDAGPNLFPCLPPGEEKIEIEVTGSPSLVVTTPDGVSCLSRFLPATASEDALLDLQWNAAGISVFVVVRMRDVMPGQTGVFTPFSVLLSQGAEAWASLGDQCRVTIADSTKIGEMPQPPSSVQEFYRVAGSMACDIGWAAGKPNDELKMFEFATRATFLRGA